MSGVPTVARADWTLVQRWSGNGNLTTETFEVTSRDWQIHWEAVPAANGPDTPGLAAMFQIEVYDANTGTPLSVVADAQGPGNVTDTDHRGPGRFYLMINSRLLDWTVTVQDDR